MVMSLPRIVIAEIFHPEEVDPLLARHASSLGVRGDVRV